MQKIILYYKFIPIADIETVLLWQRALCEQLELQGRVLISHQGINGTLGGDLRSLKMYKRAMNEHSLFKDITYKWSDGSAADFTKLSVKIRPEIVTLGWQPEVGSDGVKGTGPHLKPSDLETFLEQYPDAVFFDARNNYESAIGKFKNAITPDVETFKELVSELDKPTYQPLKEKPIVTYCTGGVRCETLSSLMKQKGFQNVYQLDGGIMSYGLTYGDQGLWEGKCYVFDKRLKISFSNESKDIGRCQRCGAKTSNQINCSEKSCNKQIIICENCNHHHTTACPHHSLSAVQ